MKYENIAKNDNLIFMESAEAKNDGWSRRLTTYPSLTCLLESEAYEYYVVVENDKDIVVPFAEMVQSSARRAISNKDIEEIKKVIRVCIAERDEKQLIRESYSTYHIAYVATNYIYQYLKHYYGIEDSFKEFLENGSRHLHYFNEPWTHNIPEEEQPQKIPEFRRRKFGKIAIY